MAEIACVLGMHRSGTSLAAGLLAHLGWDLGPPEKLMGPKFDNPKGFWEYEPFTELNDEILGAFGGTWNRPPELPRRWERDRRLRAVRTRARAAVRRDFGRTSRWAWKDPRTSLTLPFWRRLLGPMGYVLCLRSPVDVGQSLLTRDGIAIEAGAALWETYVASALRHTAGEPRVLVFYEDLVDDWEAEARRIGEVLGVAGPVAGETRAAVDRFVSGELRHHATPVGEVAADPRVPPRARALFVALRGAVDARRAGAPEADRLEAAAQALAAP